MTSKQKKGLRGSIDDVLGDLLGESNDLPVNTKTPPAVVGRPKGIPPSRSGKRSLLDDDFFSKLAEEVEKDDEASDVSEADPKALLESMKDIDDMDADLFGSKRKPSSAPPQSKIPGRSKPGELKPGGAAKAGQTADEEPENKKPNSAPAAAVRGYKKFSFMDDNDEAESLPVKQDVMDDPLDDLLDNMDKPKSDFSGKTEKPASPSPVLQKKEELASPAPKKRDELTFDDDDDLMDALGFSDAPKARGNGLTPKKESSEMPQRARTRLDEILGIGTSPHLMERPATGERKIETQPERTNETSTERQTPKNSAGKDSMFGEEDFTFGSYQPTVGYTPEGRQSRRQSVRFSMEDVSSHSPERRPKLSNPPTPTSTRPGRPASDWLGLKRDEDEEEEEQDKPETKEPAETRDSHKPPPSPSRGGGKATGRTGSAIKPAEERRVVPSSPKTARSAAPGPQMEEEEEEREEEEEMKTEEKEDAKEDDWLTGALSRKKTQTEEREMKQEEALGLGEEIDLNSFSSKQSTTVASRRRQDGPRRQASESVMFSGRQQSSPHTPNTNTAAQHTAVLQQRPASENTAPVQQVVLSSTQPQVTLSADSIQQLLLQQQVSQPQLWGLASSLDLASLQRQRRDTEQQAGEVTSLQAKIIQLEGQVRSLQLERDQLQMLLESVQQRHKQDTELMENTHRARVKLLEESAAQREARARLEAEDLAERLAAVTRVAEQERTELQAQHQRRLAQCQQERDREVERLRELQRKSILEMKTDHEEQIQRLRRLKDEEIDAVTSATSQTRSLTVVIEQMEKFSHRLGDLSTRVQSTHENTSHSLELGARQRDEQLRVLQDRLTQQQREMAEERARLKEVIAKMDTQLAEQQRQLQQERWRVTAEHAKAESALRGLEEERRTMSQHFAMEREELERAKSALLEEQQCVMQRCAEERRKLAAEWTQFHTQEKVRQERLEREASRAMERDAHREGTILGLAQEQAELKLRAGELKQREDALQQEREKLDKIREEMEREKERVSAAALRLKTRAQEVESLSKLASERYEEGERALQEARQTEGEQQTRLRSIHTEMERLRKQEQSLQQERVRMMEHCRDVERMRHTLPINPVTLSTAPLITDFSAFTASQLGGSVAVPPPAMNVSSTSVSPELQARIALLKHTAQKDRDILEDEQFYLDTLKKRHTSA